MFTRFSARTARSASARSLSRSPRTRLILQCLEDRIAPAFSEFVDPHPVFGNQFGSTVVALSTGNVVITSPFDDAGGEDAGAVYLFNGATGALISTLLGSHASDHIGSESVIALTNGNYVIRSSDWDNGTVLDAGAVTWGSGTTGVSGIISPANSLVGSKINDAVGFFSVIPLTNGNYVVHSAIWDNGAVVDAGAVTWGSGTIGVSGTISAANSLVGSSTNDRIGGEHYRLPDVIALNNGNYVVASGKWDNGAVVDAGAVTWGSGMIGVSGTISSANSLVGSKTEDRIGASGSAATSSVTALSNGNYIVRSSYWDNGAIVDAGAVTWCNGISGSGAGTITAINSLVGSSESDRVGYYDIVALPSGNYVVPGPNWDNGSIADVGAATWANGTIGIAGSINATNSLIGATSGDQISGGINSAGVVVLKNGNYVVPSYMWDNGISVDAGAVTWGSGTMGISGVVSEINSVVGSTVFDQIGFRYVDPLENGNYIVRSSVWTNGDISAAGAVRLCDGQGGTVGPLSAANSLVGATENDFVGSDVIELTNGNFVVLSRAWQNGSGISVGAATWSSGTTPLTGTVTAANSLIGTKYQDLSATSVKALTNGNYVVASPRWDNGSIGNAGAVTWASGQGGTIGLISPANSLVGSASNDSVGWTDGVKTDVTLLPNGNYVVASPLWNNGSVLDAGAVTWGNGLGGTVGVVTAANSLVGSKKNDQVGSGALGSALVLSNGNYLVLSPNWDNGAVVDAGAVTWGNGATGTSGVVSSSNSLLGSSTGDGVGIDGNEAVTLLPNGNFVVKNKFADNGNRINAGAVTWGNGSTGTSGTLNSSNSLLGSVAYAGLQSVVVDHVNGTFLSSFTADAVGGRVRLGSQTKGFAPPSVSSVVFGDGTAQRSLVKQLVVTFSEPVNFMYSIASAFTLRRSGTGGTFGDVTLTANPPTGPASVVTITFSGALTEFDSLVDGLYDLTINPAQVSGVGGALDGNGDLIPGGSYYVIGTTANKFFRFFGDSDGDGALSQATDLIAFRNAFASPSAIFDFDNDGSVDQDDFIKFRNNFGGGP